MITQKIFETFKFWFADYVNKFILEYPNLSENLEIKADHCWRVRKEIYGLTLYLKYSEEDTLLAETIGLFHDLGRFKQYVKYQTFSDSKSQNHAELGVEVLKENRVLKDLSVDDKNLIYKSILNHSRAAILPDENERVNSFSNLIRDADKLDIWRLITEYYMVKEQKENKTLELELPNNNEISDDVYNAILNNKVVLKESMKTLTDFKLLQIGWLFDLNYNYSIKRLFEKKYLDKIFDTLPENQKVNQIKEIVSKYFKCHLKTLNHN